MFFILTIILISVGVILVRQRKEKAGYALLILGWAHAIFQNVYTDKSFDAAFTTFFLGVAFVWYVQVKMGKHTKRRQ